MAITRASCVLVLRLAALAALCQCGPPVPTPPLVPPPCGGAGEVCCVRAGQVASDPGALFCNGGGGCGLDGRCASACGAPGQVCCAGDTCTTSGGQFAACRPQARLCYPCGGTGQPCCPANVGLPICVIETDRCSSLHGDTCQPR